MLKDIRTYLIEPIIIYYDKKSILSMSKDLVLHSKKKNISIKYHVLREKATKKEIRLEYVSINDQIANRISSTLPLEPTPRWSPLKSVILWLPP